MSVSDPPRYLHEYEYLTLARVAISSVLSDRNRRDRTDNALDQVIGLLNRLLVVAEAEDRTGSIIKVLVVLALASEAQGNVSGAISSLERALILSEPEGYVRIFAECGAPMARLLRKAMTRGITPTYTNELLSALKTWGHPSETLSPSPIPHFQRLSVVEVEPLSQREQEVLRLLTTELSGPEIARELVVALGTVRTHTKRIYSKLNVTNRRAAVKRATELSLI